jgi:hypothetical protein
MAEVQLRSLRVGADFDSSSYVAGMNAKVAADKAGAASSVAVGAALTQTDAKVSTSADNLERLKRQFLTGYAASQDFDRGLATIKRGLDGGKISIDDAAIAIENLGRKYGQAADAARPIIASSEQLGQAATIARTRIAEQATAVDELAASYRRMAAEARAAQAADNAETAFNRSFNIAQPGASASASASVFEEELRQQEELARRQQEIARLRAQQAGANFGSDLNSRFGIGGDVNSARASASVFEAEAQAAELAEQKIVALKAAIDPVGTSWAAMNRQIAEYNDLLRSGAISIDEFAQAETLARQRHEQLKASLGTGPLGTNDNNASFRRQNLGYQAIDIVQGIASGQPLGMIAAQQSGQIGQSYLGPGGGLAGVKSDLAALGGVVASVATAIGPIGLAFGAASIAATAFYFGTRQQAKTTDEALKEHAANIKALGDAYGLAAERAKTYSAADQEIASAAARQSQGDLQKKQAEQIEALRTQFGTNTNFRGAPAFILNPGFAAFTTAFSDLKAKADLPKFIEDVRQIGAATGFQDQAEKIIAAAKALSDFNDELEKGKDRLTDAVLRQLPALPPLGNFGNLNDEQNNRANRTPSLFQQQQNQINAIRLQAAARSPQEQAAAARAAAEAQFNQGESTTARANRIELAEKQALITAEQQLTRAQEDRQRASQASLDQAQYEVSLIGKSVEERNRLMAAYQAEAQIREQAARDHVAADEAEIASARKKAAAVADANAQVSLGKLVQDQGFDAQRLQLEANLIGATADERARATAALEAEIRLKQQGIDTSSALAQGYIKEQEALAQAKQEIDRQNAAYQSLQQAQGSVIDDLVTGTGTMKERLQAAASDVLKWFNEIAVANPLKNALTGTNLPTLADLFSGKPQVPGATATNTGAMTVTAAAVYINGSPLGGLPGLPGTNNGGLAGLLGYNPANANNPTGAAPVIPVQRLPLPSIYDRQDAAALSSSPTNMLAYQQAISKIESGSFVGNYSALGPTLNNGDYAIGRYQIMASNVPAWSQKYLGQQITPQQLQANPAYQDAIFNGEFGGYVDRYGPSGAASKWFTGSPTISNRMDINGTTGNQYVNQFNQNLAKLSTTTAETTNNFTGLGDSTKTLQSSFADFLGGTKLPAAPGAFPAAPMGQGYFPPAPTASFNPLSFLKSIPILGNIFSLFGFADGTDFSPGGLAMVGERGRELVNLPRGSQVIPNHRLKSVNDNGPRSVTHRYESNIVVSGSGDKELMENMRVAADEISRAHFEEYRRNYFGDDINNYRSHPFQRG